MKKRIPLATCFAILSLGVSMAFGQGASSRPGSVIVPDTNVQRPSDIGARFHTNYLIFIPRSKLVLSGPSGETPGSLACIYKLVNSSDYPNCTISDAITPPSGGSGTIAVVDAYDYPTAPKDFAKFSDTFSLPSGDQCGSSHHLACFRQVYAAGKPRKNAGWALEAATDIEWAHAMAPDAQIVLVEAASNRTSDLFDAVDVATNEVVCGHTTCPGGGTGTGVVSMSWGGSEFSQEDTFDGSFDNPGVVYTAASGDSALTPSYPSTSPYVLSAGGTTVNRDQNGDFQGETAWGDSGGGLSAVESEPGYQTDANPAIGENLNGMRGTPDFSYDSDPNTGVSVYDKTPYQGLSGWFVIGGTSVSAQALAGIIDLAGGASASQTTQDVLGTIYSDYTNTSHFTDITSGTVAGCHPNPHRTCYSAHDGWDFLTGVGTDLGTSGK